MTYERLGCELDTDLIGVCRRCHKRVEKYPKLKACTTAESLTDLFIASRKNKKLLL